MDVLNSERSLLEFLKSGGDGQVLGVQNGRLAWRTIQSNVVNAVAVRTSGGQGSRGRGGGGNTVPENADGRLEAHNHESAGAGGQLNINGATTGTLQTGKGGTGRASYSTGDLLVGDENGGLTALGIGDAGNLLSSSGGRVRWTTFAGAVQGPSDARYVKKFGDTMTGTLTISVSGGNASSLGLRVLNTLSGAVLHAEKSLTSSGMISVSGSASFGSTGTFAGNLSTRGTLSGAALTVMAGNSYLMGNVGIGTTTVSTWGNGGNLQTAILSVSGALFASNPNGEHTLINGRTTSGGGNITNSNVLKIRHMSPFGSSAIRFVQYDDKEGGAVGYNNGNGSFYLDNSAFLSANIYDANGNIINGAAPPKLILGQEGWYNGAFRLTARFVAGTDWSMNFQDPVGSSIMYLGTDGNIGIGNQSPAYKNTNASSDTALKLAVDPTTSSRVGIDGSNTLGALDFAGKNSGNNYIRQSVILSDFTSSTAGAEGGYLAFYTKPTNSSVAERMRIDSTGNIGIGTTAPKAKLDVVGTISGTTVLGSNGLTTKVISGACSDSNAQSTDGTICIDSADGGRIYFRYGGAWHYAAQTAGFQIPNLVTDGDNETAGLDIGDLVVGKINQRLDDGALHGLWVKFDLQTEIGRTLSEHPELLTNAMPSSNGPSVSLSELNDLALHGALTVAGNATFLGDVSVHGVLSLNSRQAGLATIPAGQREIHVEYLDAFAVAPLVMATPQDVPDAYWGIVDQTPEGFTIQLSAPMSSDLSFSWAAIPTNASDDPQQPASAAEEPATVVTLQPFSVDENGVPLTGNAIEDACIRNVTPLDSEGQPYNCSRYHDGNNWQYGTSTFEWNTQFDPPRLTVPDGYVTVVQTDTAPIEADSGSGAVEAGSSSSAEAALTVPSESDTAGSGSAIEASASATGSTIPKEESSPTL